MVATSIVNIWACDPAVLASEVLGARARLSGTRAGGHRVGHPGRRAPGWALSAMRTFWTVSTPPPPLRATAGPAALAPVFALSAERSLGAIPCPSFRSARSTARAQLGAGPLLTPELACVLDTDAERARATARVSTRASTSDENAHEQPARARLHRRGPAGDGSDA
jgi:hypothetical protein